MSESVQTNPAKIFFFRFFLFSDLNKRKDLKIDFFLLLKSKNRIFLLLKSKKRFFPFVKI